MRFTLLLSVLFTGTIAFAQQTKTTSSFIRPLPSPPRNVNDFGKFLAVNEKQFLEDELLRYNDKTGNAIVIITLPSLTDPKTNAEYTLEQAALEYFNTWGIGDHIKNNGVLIFLSRNPRGARIQTSSGIEDALTNFRCQAIINDKMLPAFKAGLYFMGLKDAVKEIEWSLDNAAATQRAATTTYATTPATTTPVQPVYKAPPREPMTWKKFFQGILGLIVLTLCYGLYKGIKRRFGRVNDGQSFSSGSYDGGGGTNIQITNTNVNSIGRGFFWWLGRRSRSYSSGGGGYHSSGGGSYSSGGSSSSSGSSSSGSASRSFGGGSSSGGGASGSW